MAKLYNTLFAMVFAILSGLPAWAADKVPDSSSTSQQRELIYCADYMTHEEREAYRAKKRAARNPGERDAVREAHKNEMDTRLNERGIVPLECEPQRYRERLRLRERGGGQ